MKYDHVIYKQGRKLRSWPWSRKNQDYFIRLGYGAARIARQFEEYFDKDPELMRPALLALIIEVMGGE